MKGRNGVAGGRGYTIGTRTNKRITREGEREDGMGKKRERGGLVVCCGKTFSLLLITLFLFHTFLSFFSFSFRERERKREGISFESGIFGN